MPNCTKPRSPFRNLHPALAALLTAPLVLASTLAAQEDGEQPLEEVFLSELAYTQEKGELQVTLAPRFGRRGGETAAGLGDLEIGARWTWEAELFADDD